MTKKMKTTKKKLKILGCDPGSKNYGFTCLTARVKNGYLKTHIHEIGMFQRCINNLTAKPAKPPKSRRKKEGMWAPLQEQLPIFEEFWAGVLDEFKPDIFMVERYQARGGKGTTIECVSIMNGIIASLCLDRNIEFMMITAATWKNRVNSQFDLEDSYKQVDFPDHMVDSSFIGVYGAVQYFDIAWDEVDFDAHLEELQSWAL